MVALLVAAVTGGVYAVGDHQPVQGDKLVGLGQLGQEPWDVGYGYAVRGDFVELFCSGEVPVPYDIKAGMKIIYMTFSPDGRTIMEALLAWANVDPDEVIWVPADSYEKNTELLLLGQGHVAFGAVGFPSWYEAEAAPHGLAWIELNSEADPAGAARFFEVTELARSWLGNPYVTHFGPLSAGVPTAIGVWGMLISGGGITYYSCFYFTNPDCVEEITITRVSIIRDDGTVIYEAPYLADGQTMTTMGPHETWCLPLVEYVLPDSAGSSQLPWLIAGRLPLASYTVEIAWEAKRGVCPLTGWQQTVRLENWREPPGTRYEAVSQSQMVNLKQGGRK